MKISNSGTGIKFNKLVPTTDSVGHGSEEEHPNRNSRFIRNL